ncbi:hypothetical protein HMN09_01427400 [Mycena chlorophos]|uniref:Uncharacterized protein n=1 Tax=Mycena chlorophos TaxID=658473 RepID=A0A8H6RYR4_MYCCL|nr:hypothetical protein HMN09_01427400 [Mycena chlorophos]
MSTNPPPTEAQVLNILQAYFAASKAGLRRRLRGQLRPHEYNERLGRIGRRFTLKHRGIDAHQKLRAQVLDAQVVIADLTKANDALTNVNTTLANANERNISTLRFEYQLLYEAHMDLLEDGSTRKKILEKELQEKELNELKAKLVEAEATTKALARERDQLKAKTDVNKKNDQVRIVGARSDYLYLARAFVALQGTTAPGSVHEGTAPMPATHPQALSLAALTPLVGKKQANKMLAAAATAPTVVAANVHVPTIPPSASAPAAPTKKQKAKPQTPKKKKQTASGGGATGA